jgi:transcriptional regulator with XRE-family HTH domain
VTRSSDPAAARATPAEPMIQLASYHQLGPILRRLRQTAGLTQAQVAEQSFVTKKAICARELHGTATTAGALIEHAAVFGYDLALIPSRRPGARTTGTGWPT